MSTLHIRIGIKLTSRFRSFNVILLKCRYLGGQLFNEVVSFLDDLKTVFQFPVSGCIRMGELVAPRSEFEILISVRTVTMINEYCALKASPTDQVHVLKM